MTLPSGMRGLAWLVPAAVWLAAGCGPSHEAAPSSVAAAAPSALMVFTKVGLPGPWSRRDATREGFERDSRTCRDRSSDARSAVGSGDGSDAAYRAFLDCMRELRWTRGAVPARAPDAPAT